MARRIIVEIELPEGVELGEVLKGVKYRVISDTAGDKEDDTDIDELIAELRKGIPLRVTREDLRRIRAEERRRILEKYTGILGKASSEELENGGCP